MFSALEVVPLTLLTLDAWDFIKLTGTKEISGTPEKSIPHKWAFFFLMAVGFWNFVGAGIFGFLINMPVVSYFEAGTVLTLNHGHAALLGAFGMLGMALLVLTLRHVLTEEQWAVPEKFIKISFWGLNIGLALMVITNLFPVGVLQLWDVLENGYWHARSLEFIGQDRIRQLEWWSMPSHVVLIALGVVPMVIASRFNLPEDTKSLRADRRPLPEQQWLHDDRREQSCHPGYHDGAGDNCRAADYGRGDFGPVHRQTNQPAPHCRCIREADQHCNANGSCSLQSCR